MRNRFGWTEKAGAICTSCLNSFCSILAFRLSMDLRLPMFVLLLKRVLRKNFLGLGWSCRNFLKRALSSRYLVVCAITLSISEPLNPLLISFCLKNRHSFR